MNPLNDAPDRPDEPPFDLPIDDVLDLHSVPPRDAKPVLEAWLEQVEHRGFSAIRIIHGRGIGVQREMVREVLARTPSVRSFGDAPAEAGGWGATIANLGPPPVATPSPLEQCLGEFQAIRQNAQSLTASLSPPQWNWRPAPQSWSIGQCLQHLARVDRMYVDVIRDAVEEGHRRHLLSPGPFRYGILERWVVRSTEPPPGFRISAPPLFRPDLEPESVPLRETIDAFFARNSELQDLRRRAEGLDLARVRVPSPAIKLWKWSLGIVFAVTAAHDRRHLHQAERIRRSPAFPPS